VQPADVITEIYGKRATSAEQLQASTLTKKPGDTVKLTIDRNGCRQTASVALTAIP
jgi:S1-C subfamily serine protease